MTRAGKAEKSDRRIQLDISEGLYSEIEEMKRQCDIATTKELLNNALTALQWMVQQVASGRVVVSADRTKSDFEVFWMPALRAAARAAEQQRGKGT
jgi:hypothetical protein